MKKSVLIPFYNAMDLESFPEKDRNGIIRIVIEFLLGCRKFGYSQNALKKYECHSPFQKVLKELTPEYQFLYRKAMRNYVQGNTEDLHDFDRYHLDCINFGELEVRKYKFPRESEVMKSMAYTVNSMAFKLGANRKVRRMTYCGINDIKQVMFMRILSAYRTYLPSVGKLLPVKAFYSVMHKALASSIIDKIREFDTKKAQMIVPFSILGEDFEANAENALYSQGKVSSSPEEILEAKETFYMDIPFEERIQYSW